MYGGEGIRIGFGTICIEIQCSDRELLEKWRTDYRPFLVSQQPDFHIEFTLGNRLTASRIKSRLRTSYSYVEGDRFFTRPRLLEQHVDWKTATLHVETEKELFAPDVDYKLMNSLIRGIYWGIYTRVKNMSPEAYLVHGCGIVDGSRCYLFTGPSGSGKTTVAGLSEGRKVLNDEAVLIGRNKTGFYLTGTPFTGGIPDRCSDTAPLSSVFFLRHSREVTLRRLSEVETYRGFLTQFFDTSPLHEAAGIDSLQERANISAEVARAVPSYELGFLPSRSFWDAVESIDTEGVR